MHHIVKGEGRDNPIVIYRGVVLAIVMMFLITPLYEYGYKFSCSLTDAVNSVSKIDSNEVESKISNVLLNATLDADNMSDEDIEYLLKHWKSVDINETKQESTFGTKYYKYSLSIFVLIVIVLVTIVLFFFLAIQMAKRVLELALYRIIGPFCCTSLTSDKSRAFEVWLKGTLGLFLVTAVQFIGIGLLINLFGSTFEDTGFLTSIFLIIGALIFIISSPTIINSLLEQQMGIMGGFYELQTLMSTTQVVSTGLNIMGSVGNYMFNKGSGLSNYVKNRISSSGGSSGDAGLKADLKESMASGTQFNKAKYMNFNNSNNGSQSNRTTGFNNNISSPNFSRNFTRPYNLSYNSMNNKYNSQINFNNRNGE